MAALTVTVKTTGDQMADLSKRSCMEAINNLGKTEVKNLKKLVNNPKAMAYLGSNLKFMMLQKFL